MRYSQHDYKRGTRVPKTTLKAKSAADVRSEIERTLVRLAHEILEKNGGVDGLGLGRNRRRGVPLAERLGKMIQQVEKKKVPSARSISRSIAMTFLPWGRSRGAQETEIGFSIEGKKIVLVDDVLYTGRHHARRSRRVVFSWPSEPGTAAGADRSRPSRIAGRGHVRRSNPCRTTDNEVIEVKLTEIDAAEKVLLMER